MFALSSSSICSSGTLITSPNLYFVRISFSALLVVGIALEPLVMMSVRETSGDAVVIAWSFVAE